jgi:nitroreductase
MNCGHCLSACPYGALTLEHMHLDQCPAVPKEQPLDAELIKTLYRTRRSIRVFENKPVDQHILNQVIDMCRYAPSGHNSQSVHWVVVSGRDKVKRFSAMTIDSLRYILKKQPAMAKQFAAHQVIKDYEAGIDPICWNAPHLIFAMVPVPGGQTDLLANFIDMANGVIALNQLELALPSLGLGGCWTGHLTIASSSWPPLRNALEMPQSHMTCGVMLVGYPKYPYHRVPQRDEPKINWL